MKTTIFFVSRVSASHWSIAYTPAGFFVSSELSHRFAISAAPDNSDFTSMPMRAAGSVPTALRTLNRPPTLAGMSSAGTLRRSARGRSAPCFGSVTNTSCLDTSSFSLVIRSCTMRNWAIVSAVPPDLDVTIKSVRSRRSRPSKASMVSGSTLSST